MLHSKLPLKVLLLENIHSTAREMFAAEGCEVEALAEALPESRLIEKIRGVNVLGIRSKTQVTEKVFAEANDLITMGAFCIGTNQIALHAAKVRGIPVFNAPFGNTRSVAEMTIAEIIMLSRRLGLRNLEMHQGIWNKVSKECFEIRGKTLGIIGYGNIGSQVSTMAENLGMRVVFFDIVSKLPLGNARGCSTMAEVLKLSDFVTLHVPATHFTRNMIGATELALMKAGACLLNASRGNVVVIEALADALKAKRLGGAAIDVFPEEPEANGADFQTPLRGLANVILTPHIGGATEEAQAQIGEEVPTALLRFLRTGSTLRAVNFPELDLPFSPTAHRILNVHKNVPGVLREVNRIISDLGANIQAQGLATDSDVGYLLLDTDKALSGEVRQAVAALPSSIQTRVLY
ncbi:MAG: phosphoglycerate dehydrogenase [Oligoflexia bacterium]